MSISITAKRAAAGLTMAALGFMSVLAPATAASAGEVPNRPATVENVGGGTWNYGTGTGCGLSKCAWSHYQHNSVRHSATSICGSSNVKVWKDAGTWADADTSCGWAQSSAAYWGTA